MAAINPIQQAFAAPVETILPSSDLLTLKELVTIVFIAAVAALASNFWGLAYGLLAGFATSLTAVIIDSLCSKQFVFLSQELGIRNEEMIAPQRRNFAELDGLDEEGAARHMENIEHLLEFDRTIRNAIIRQSPHYESAGPFRFLRDYFPGMDYSRLTLLGVKPFRFRTTGQEGYEIAIRSEIPQGFIYFCVLKNGVLQEAAGEMERIEKVTPFLRREQAEANHLSILELPFRRIDSLHLKLAADYRDMDLCQVELDGVRPVRFDYVYQPIPQIDPVINTFDGFELNFRTPAGPVRYYTDAIGEHVASPAESRNIADR